MSPRREKERARGERVLPGLWRLRLPCPWPGVPHGNAWAIADGDGIVLVDTGVWAEDSMAGLRDALGQVGLTVEQVRLLLITHAHNDHWGQAKPIVEAAGCEMWVHPASRLALRHLADPEADMRLRLEVGRQSGLSEAALEQIRRRLDRDPTFAGPVASARDLVAGVSVTTDLGSWQVVETPGHSPSHVCLHQPEHRLLISGDHLLGRTVLWFDRGDTPDPVAEYLASLDAVAGLQARLALSGHGKPFLDVPGHIASARRAVGEQTDNVLVALGGRRRTALEVATAVADGSPRTQVNPVWRLPLTLCVLDHLEQRGLATAEDEGELRRWRTLDQP